MLRAQPEVQRFNRQLDQIRRQTQAIPDNVPFEQRALLDYGAFANFTYFSIDDPTGKSHGLRQPQIFPWANFNFDGANQLYLRGFFGYDDWNSGESLDGDGDEFNCDLDRGFYRFDYRSYQNVYHHTDPGFDLYAKGGRDLVYWANGLVLSQVLDGVFLGGGNDFFHVDLIAGVTPEKTVDIDSSRPNFDDDTTRGFYGAMLSTQLGRHRPFLYGLVQQDYNQDNVGVSNGITTVYDYNSWYIGAGVNGSLTDKLLYGVEVAYEGGSTLSNSFHPVPGVGLAQDVQTQDPIQALAADFRLDYLLRDKRQTRFTFETVIASGDSDRLTSSTNTFGGNARNTTDRAFNSFGLINTGLAFAPQVSNLLMFRIGAVTFPLPEVRPLRRFQVGVDLFFYNKLVSDAPIDEETTDSSYLGFEPDLYINWQITSDVTLAFRYGIFFPGSGIIDPHDDTRQFFSAGVTYAF